MLQTSDRKSNVILGKIIDKSDEEESDLDASSDDNYNPMGKKFGVKNSFANKNK